jgi:hypothetical protein
VILTTIKRAMNSTSGQETSSEWNYGKRVVRDGRYDDGDGNTEITRVGIVFQKNSSACQFFNLFSNSFSAKSFSLWRTLKTGIGALSLDCSISCVQQLFPTIAIRVWFSPLRTTYRNIACGIFGARSTRSMLRQLRNYHIGWRSPTYETLSLRILIIGHGGVIASHGHHGRHLLSKNGLISKSQVRC